MPESGYKQTFNHKFNDIMDNYSLILDFIDYKIHKNSFCSRMADMAFKRSAVRSRLYPSKVVKSARFHDFFFIFM